MEKIIPVKLMGFIGGGIGFAVNWGEVVESGIGAGVGAIVAILINESWKFIYRKYISSKSKGKKKE